MDHNFDIFVKEHLQAILCEVEKDHALAFIRKARVNSYMHSRLKLPRHLVVPDIPLQDCTVSSSFSESHL